MAPFLRIAFNAYDVGALPPLTDTPICAIKMKESVNTGMYRCTHTYVVMILYSQKGGTVSRETRRPEFNCLNSHRLLGSKIHMQTDSLPAPGALCCSHSCDFPEKGKVTDKCFVPSDDRNLLSQSEERLWSRGSPPCIQPGSPHLMLTSMRGVS